MVYGIWCMVYGVWCMVYGVWCMVYGTDVEVYRLHAYHMDVVMHSPVHQAPNGDAQRTADRTQQM